MSVNLIEMAKRYLTPEVVQKLSNAAGISPEQTQKVMGMAVPSVLGGVVQNVSSEQGANRMLDLARQKGFDGSMLDSVKDRLGGTGTGGLIDSGKELLGNLLGGKTDAIADTISRSTGTGKSSVMTLLAAAAPFVMNLIGKVKNEQGLSAGGLREMLMSQKDVIGQYVPAGLAGALGLSGLSGAGDQFKERAASVTDQIGAGRSEYGSARAGTRDRDSGSTVATVSVIALICLAALAGWWLWRNREQPMAQTETSPPVAAAPGESATPRLRGEPIEDAVTTTLPSGQSIQLEPGSPLLGVAQFLSTGTPAAEPRSFVLRNIEMNAEGNALSPESTRTIEQLAQILAGYPEARVAIRSASQAGAQQDQQTGDVRAQQIQSALIERGIPAERVRIELAATQPGAAASPGNVELVVDPSG